MIATAELWAFDVALQDDQLLPEKGILGDNVGLAADGILNRSCDQRARAGFEQLLDALSQVALDGAEDLRSETMKDMEHALIAPEV